MKGGAKVLVEAHRHAGVFVARGKEDALVTRNLVPGESVYGEKRISVEAADVPGAVPAAEGAPQAAKVEYRVWNPFRSKLAAAVLGGVDAIHVVPGAKVLYLGAASGTSVSHVSDIVGPEGAVYAVEFSHRSGRVQGLIDGTWTLRLGAHLVVSARRVARCIVPAHAAGAAPRTPEGTTTSAVSDPGFVPGTE